jgi:tetratricopeptide (TPR) repeat protein
MKEISNIVIKLLAIVLLITTAVKAGDRETVAELIEQAHKHDNMYTSGPEAGQQKAVSLYQSALEAGPDDEQRLHILYRMAQLYGSAYQLEKGEKPDFRKAISLYKQIIDSYSPDEPLVFKAMISIGDHHVTLKEFTTAIDWFKRALEYDVSEMEKSLKTLQAERKKKEAAALKKTIDSIKRYQKVAVSQVAYAVTRIHPYLHNPVLQGIIDKYKGSFIAEKAQQLIDKNPRRMPELEIPLDFGEKTALSSPTLQANAAAPVVSGQQSQKGIKIQSDTTPEVKGQRCPVEPNMTDRLQKDKRSAGETRAPPLSYPSKCVIGAAGLIVLGLAVVIIRKKTTSF